MPRISSSGSEVSLVSQLAKGSPVIRKGSGGENRLYFQWQDAARRKADLDLLREKGIATSGATVSPFLPTGVAPEVVSADGEPANPEDLLIAYALGVPYVGQHGDDRARWQERFGDLVVAPEDSLGMKPAPTASRQHQLAWARTIADRVLDAARARGVLVSVAVVDTGGDPVQQDRMDGAVTASPDLALATGATAARFGRPSDELDAAYGFAVKSLGRLGYGPFLGAPGGVPVLDGGVVVAGLGVGGADPALCAQIAREVASS